MLEQPKYYEAEEPIYKCRWCGEEVDEEPLCPEEDTYEDEHWAEYEGGGAEYRGSTFYEVLTGVCAKCFDEAITTENIFAFSKEGEDLATGKDKFDYSVVSWLYSMDDLLELAKKDMRERLASGVGLDEDRVKKAMYDYAHADEEAFVEFMDKYVQK